MAEPIDRLALKVTQRLTALSLRQPSERTVRSFLRLAYLVSLKTEEGRFVRATLTYAHPDLPHIPPPTRRADYPSFTRFQKRIPLSVESLAKLARAIDRWSGAIAVHGSSPTSLFAWGVVDQLVQESIMLNRESESGFANPGAMTVSIDGVGELSVYHGTLFLGALRLNQVVHRENDVLGCVDIASRIEHEYGRVAASISAALEDAYPAEVIQGRLVRSWAGTISRLCIGLRRAGTGGAS